MTDTKPTLGRRAAILSLWTAAVLAAAPARAEYDFVKIADTTTPVPGGTGTFFNFADPALDGQDVVFRGRLNDTFPFEEGVYTFSAATGLVKIVDPADLVPGSIETIDFVSQGPTISAGRTAFLASDETAGFHAIVTAPVGGGALTLIANSDTEVPGTGGVETFDFLSGGVRIDADRVLLRGEGTGGTIGLYAANADGTGSPTTIADTDTLIPGGGGQMFSNIEPTFPGGYDLSGTNAVFVGHGTTFSGIYAGDMTGGSLNKIVDTTDAFPGPGGGTFEQLFLPRIEGNDVVFVGLNAAGQFGVFRTDLTGSSLTAIVDSTTVAPGTTDPLDVALLTGLDQGNSLIVGISGGSARIGLYTDLNGPLEKVIDSDDMLDGKPIATFLPQNDNLSDGAIVFTAQFDGGDTAVFVAIQEHHWEPNSGGSWDDGGNWSFGGLPRNVVPTFIQPDNGVIVAGPAAPQHVRSLTIGAQQSGVAELHLQSAGSLLVDELLTVTASGALRVGGALAAVGGLDNHGLVSGDGQVDAVLTNRLGAAVRVGAGQHLRFTGAGTHTNLGMVEAIDGQVEFYNPLTNAASTGLITGRNAMLRFNGGLTNNGSMALSFGASDIFGDVDNAAGGAIAVAGNSNATFYDDVVNDGTLNVAAGSTAVFFGALAGNGNVGGGDVQALGDLVPGASPGTMSFGGNLTITDTTHLQIEIAGTTPGSQFDQLTVAGDAALAGALSVSLIDGFALSAGDSFEIIRIDGARSGMFAGLTEGATIGNFGGSDLVITYAAGDGNDVALFAPGLAGDYNGDGSVDAADYVVWRNDPSAFGGDPAGYNTWRANFGATSGGGPLSSASVPEPATALLLCIGAVSSLACRAKRGVLT